MSKILHHLKLPGDEDFREIVDLKTSNELYELVNTRSGKFGKLIYEAIGLYKDEQGYLCYDPDVEVSNPTIGDFDQEETPDIPDVPDVPDFDSVEPGRDDEIQSLSEE